MWQIPFLVIGGYGALVIHELGHLLAAHALGINAVTQTIGLGPTISRICDGSGTIWAFRVLPIQSTCGFCDGPEPLVPTRSAKRLNARPSIGRPSIPRRAAILIAGPLSNLAFACALLLVTNSWDPKFAPPHLGEAGSEIPLLVGGFSLALALFNLLPIPPLGGGRLILLCN
ncbi:site-2 protease family protein [Frankia sp. RB7]|nr:site-2 protease family protein [Frankia sp. RB7]